MPSPFRSIPVPENAEVIAVINFDLCTPGCSADHPSSHRRQHVDLVSNGAVTSKTKTLNCRPRSPNIGIQKKQGLIPEFEVGDRVLPGKQFIKGDSWNERTGQGFPFISRGPPPGNLVIDYNTVAPIFLRLARLVGLRGEPGQPGPRIHDLRHTFAVRSLEQCRHEDVTELEALSLVERHETNALDVLG